MKKQEDKLLVELAERNESKKVLKYYKEKLTDDYPENFTWRDLFLKLCFEQMLQYFPQHQDFKLFYKYINSMEKHILCLRIKILDKTNFKSNNYYLMTLIGRMKHLKVIKFHKDSSMALGVDGFKYISKGFKYFSENGGQLVKLQINNILGGSADEYLYQCFKCIPELRVLKINNCVLSLKDA